MAQRKFRGGKREIPDYMDDLMRGLETERMTYEEAVAAMNRGMASQQIDRAFDSMVRRHMAMFGERRR